jgi:hypothetical protein
VVGPWAAKLAELEAWMRRVEAALERIEANQTGGYVDCEARNA